MTYTKPFNELSSRDVALAGGKGASLGEMTQSGIPVPPGFVVLSSAFERFIEETGLIAEIEAQLDTVDHENMEIVEKASEAIHAVILGKDMPADIAGEITRSYADLDAGFVAVRSSATAEDSSSAAWAGQLDSFLNTTKENLLKNVQRCWASLYTPRAIFYRFEKKLHETKISVAVVVQKMVNSEKSGIAFSVHPVTQDYDQLIIEAGYGLGESIVSGQITPDSYIVDKRDWAIIEKYISSQEKGLFRKEGGGNEWRKIVDGDSKVLSDDKIVELAELIVKIENHYGFPVDVEFAVERGEFFIVQSRPITTLSKRE
ncbi:hypothetical protein J4460_05110 [Candidatus Woesearchaeota archaeon]|nr:hypothetical protein [Candidatus Woesearchaeota archaeon]HIH37308.1 hypothetical protein [Candidatus Woesearchaeota archaeon]HIH48230.1 hypothetical protein [Candidatus Woesearchaeota archaeon]HIJ04290.1 hypothetical protein [Candidatus Woesearchaeota archaeon]